MLRAFAQHGEGFPGLAILTGDAIFAERSLGAAVGSGTPASGSKNQPTVDAAFATLFAAPGPPAVVTVEKGHGRLERRTLRVRGDLVAYADCPGRAQVAELRTEVTHLTTGKLTGSSRYVVTSLGPEAADSARLLAVIRRH